MKRRHTINTLFKDAAKHGGVIRINPSRRHDYFPSFETATLVRPYKGAWQGAVVQAPDGTEHTLYLETLADLWVWDDDGTPCAYSKPKGPRPYTRRSFLNEAARHTRCVRRTDNLLEIYRLGSADKAGVYLNLGNGTEYATYGELAESFIWVDSLTPLQNGLTHKEADTLAVQYKHTIEALEAQANTEFPDAAFKRLDAEETARREAEAVHRDTVPVVATPFSDGDTLMKAAKEHGFEIVADTTDYYPSFTRGRIVGVAECSVLGPEMGRDTASVIPTGNLEISPLSRSILAKNWKWADDDTPCGLTTPQTVEAVKVNTPEELAAALKDDEAQSPDAEEKSIKNRINEMIQARISLMEHNSSQIEELTALNNALSNDITLLRQTLSDD